MKSTPYHARLQFAQMINDKLDSEKVYASTYQAAIENPKHMQKTSLHYIYIHVIVWLKWQSRESSIILDNLINDSQ